jgi:hypothetical protein
MILARLVHDQQRSTGAAAEGSGRTRSPIRRALCLCTLTGGSAQGLAPIGLAAAAGGRGGKHMSSSALIAIGASKELAGLCSSWAFHLAHTWASVESVAASSDNPERRFAVARCGRAVPGLAEQTALHRIGTIAREARGRGARIARALLALPLVARRCKNICNFLWAQPWADYHPSTPHPTCRIG